MECIDFQTTPCETIAVCKKCLFPQIVFKCVQFVSKMDDRKMWTISVFTCINPLPLSPPYPTLHTIFLSQWTKCYIYEHSSDSFVVSFFFSLLSILFSLTDLRKKHCRTKAVTVYKRLIHCIIHDSIRLLSRLLTNSTPPPHFYIIKENAKHIKLNQIYCIATRNWVQILNGFEDIWDFCFWSIFLLFFNVAGKKRFPVNIYYVNMTQKLIGKKPSVIQWIHLLMSHCLWSKKSIAVKIQWSRSKRF